MEISGKIRRTYLRNKLSLHEITKRTDLSRNTIRSWLRKPEDEAVAPAHVRKKSPGRLSLHQATLELALTADALRDDGGKMRVVNAGRQTSFLINDLGPRCRISLPQQE
ncbi:MAG: hypothetical protein ACI83P_000528 [Janthinobacterium sp.]|jgi:hypothetical protein